LARFKALQCRESGSWLHAIPSPNIGTLLDNTSFQVCIGLRLGCNLCTPHICKCNAKVDEIGIHGLSRDTLADSYVLKTSEVSGFAAEMACKRKHNKYRSIISSNYIFKGLAFETLGPWCKETIDFINVIGDRLIAESGDSKSKKFLFERISLAIQRGNAASIRGTFPDSALLSEIFAL
jgi:hypothetical protein